MRKLYVAIITASVIIIAVSISIYFLFLRRPVLYSSRSRKENYQQAQGDISSWEEFEDADSLFTLKYSPDFILLEDPARFGPGEFCLKTSNIEDRLKEAEDDMQLENCLTYHKLSNKNPIDRDLDGYAERFFSSKFDDLPTGATFVLSHREKLKLGNNYWVKAVYQSRTDGAKLYKYLAMNTDHYPVVFDAQFSNDVVYIPLFEKILTTLKFSQ